MLVYRGEEELIERWMDFFRDAVDGTYASHLFRLADRYPDERSLRVPFADVDRFDPDLAIQLLREPDVVLVAAKEATRRVAPPRESPLDLHVRVIDLPKDQHVAIRDLRSEHLGRFIAIEGLVRKATEVRPRLDTAAFECLRCENLTYQEQDEFGFREPLECSKCEKPAGSTKFRLRPEASTFVDSQKLEAQEFPEGLRGGEQPQRLTGFVLDDLCGRVNPGDRVTWNGVLRGQQKGTGAQRSTLFEIYLDVNSVEQQIIEYEELEITPEDIDRIEREANDEGIFRKIVASIAPSIYGLSVEKEAIALQLFGGVAKPMPDGRRIRGDIHLFLVGDPGTSKSEILMYVSKLAPRGIYTSGKSASAAGLTAAAVRDEFGEGRWVLEAGALVLADMGVCMIDEIDKMDPNDRSSIHTAMEQQQISVAKAGITATLQSRCAILAAANPKFGRFDANKYLAEQIDVPVTLLSRFDCIFPILDQPEAQRDRAMADYIIKGHLVGEKYRRRELDPTYVIEKELAEPYEPHFDPPFLRKYIAYAKRVAPIMTQEAMDVLREKYLEIRKQGEAAGAAVPITPRQLEAFIRLAEASARARLSPYVEVQDADRSVHIVEYWLGKVAGQEGGFDIDIVQTGMPKAQRDQIIILLDIVRELSGEDQAANADDVFRVADERGIPRARAESLLARLKADGRVFEPTEGKLRLITQW